LASTKQLKVGYILVVEDEATANQIVTQLSDATSMEAFQTAFVADLQTRVAAAGIAGVEVQGVVVSPPKKESKIEPMMNISNTTTPDPMAGYDKFKSGKAAGIGAMNGDATNWGAVVGGFIGAGVGIVILCYLKFFRRNKGQEQE
jgi:hypothetical protein